MKCNLAIYAEQAGAKVTVNAPRKDVDQSFINEAIKEIKRK
jgi:predicted RNA binding protein YcfA (HicA-like mRNA interferase family)